MFVWIWKGNFSYAASKPILLAPSVQIAYTLLFFPPLCECGVCGERYTFILYITHGTIKHFHQLDFSDALFFIARLLNKCEIAYVINE